MYRAIREGEAKWTDYLIDGEKADGKPDPTTGLNDALRGAAKTAKPTPIKLECPDKGGEPVESAGCATCALRDGCPAWEEIDKAAKDAA